MAIDSLVVNVPGRQLSDPVEQSREALRLVRDVSMDILWIAEKCTTLTRIDGEHAYVIGLRLTGDVSVKNVEITYQQGDETKQKVYSREEFYLL